MPIFVYAVEVFITIFFYSFIRVPSGATAFLSKILFPQSTGDTYATDCQFWRVAAESLAHGAGFTN